MSAILEWVNNILNSIQAYRGKKLAEEVIEGEQLEKEVEKDLKEIQ